MGVVEGVLCLRTWLDLVVPQRRIVRNRNWEKEVEKEEVELRGERLRLEARKIRCVGVTFGGFGSVTVASCERVERKRKRREGRD